MENRIVIITGPSGAGKTSLLNFLLTERGDEVKKIPTTTTREMRPGEVNGKDYHFVSERQFLEAVEENAFVEYEEVFPGKFYGIAKTEVLKALREENAVSVIVMDIHGAMKFRNHISQGNVDYEFIHQIQFEFFFIYAEEEELMSRIIADNKNGKRNDTLLSLEERSERIQTELAFADYFSPEERIKNSGDLNFVGHKVMNRILYPA